jgi:hypothetical protein
MRHAARNNYVASSRREGVSPPQAKANEDRAVRQKEIDTQEFSLVQRLLLSAVLILLILLATMRGAVADDAADQPRTAAATAACTRPGAGANGM